MVRLTGHRFELRVANAARKLVRRESLINGFEFTQLFIVGKYLQSVVVCWSDLLRKEGRFVLRKFLRLNKSRRILRILKDRGSLQLAEGGSTPLLVKQGITRYQFHRLRYDQVCLLRRRFALRGLVRSLD